MARWSPCRRTWTVRSSSSCPTGRRSTWTRCCASSAPGRCPGVEDYADGVYARSLGAARRPGRGRAVRRRRPRPLRAAAGRPSDATEAVRRCRDLLDLDADPAAVAAALGADPLIGAAGPGGARAAGARPRGRRRDGRPGRARPADLGRCRAHAGRPADRAVRVGAAGAARAGRPALPDRRRRCGEAEAGMPAAGCGRCAGWPPRSTTAWSWPGVDRAETERRCSRCPASARGRRPTWRCARCATRTSSCPPTSASGTR